jgi:hypothetical protein
MADNSYLNNTLLLSPSDLIYINTNKPLQADIINVPDTFIFTSASILQPTSYLPATTVSNFQFFVNGQKVPSSLASFNSYTGGVSVTFNTSSLGYSLETDDEIIAIGKFTL